MRNCGWEESRACSLDGGGMGSSNWVVVVVRWMPGRAGGEM